MMGSEFKTVYVTIDPRELAVTNETASEFSRRRVSEIEGSGDKLHESCPVFPLDDIVGLDSPRVTKESRDKRKAPSRVNSDKLVDHKGKARTGSSRGASNRSKSSNKSDEGADQKIKFFKLLNTKEPAKGVSEDKLEKAMAILENVPSISQDKLLFTAFDEPITALHMLCALRAPLQYIRECYKMNPEALHDASSHIGTPLHYACWFNASPKVVRYLVSKDIEAIKIKNRAKRTALHIACLRHGNPEMVILLTEAYPEAAEQKDKAGLLPLDIACASNKPKIAIVEDLTEVYPDAVAEGALHLALANKVVGKDILEDLVVSNPKALKVQDEEGRTPLHIGVMVRRKADDLKLLLSSYPKAKSLKNKKGETPLDLAVSLKRNHHILDLLER